MEKILLKTIWRWRVVSYPLAKRLCFPGIGEWNFYKKMIRLKQEGYLTDRNGPDLDCSVLQLTKKGFDYLKYDLGELKENRYASQSVAHDYWATAFQLGEFPTNQTGDVEFFTEQEILTTDDSLLPRWVPKSRDHVPDGLTLIKNGNLESVIATEVELNLKPLLRYDRAGHYYDAGLSQVDVVFWLSATTKIAQDISNRLFNMRLRNFDIHHFVLTTDFKENGWNAELLSGIYKGRTIGDVYREKGLQKPTKMQAKVFQNEIRKIFFPTLKTPFAMKT